MPLELIDLPEGVSFLGERAFASALFRELRLPSGLQVIPKEAFQRCWSLETVYLPEAIQRIDERAFLDCDRINYLVFPGIEPPQIAEDAFAECDALKDIDIAPDANKSTAAAFHAAILAGGLHDSQFSVWRANPPDQPPYDQQAKTTFDDTTGLITGFETKAKDIAMFWSHWNAAGTATLDIRGLGASVFENSGIRSFYVPHSEKFESIGARAFAGSALVCIHLFDSVKQIGDEAFADCAALREIRLPAGVSLGKDVFSGCESLDRVVIPADAVLSGSLGLPPERLFFSADAAEPQRKAAQETMGYPWYLTLPKDGEVLAFARMPDSLEPSAGSDFEFDAQTGTIRRYLGKDATVVIPHKIGGVAVHAVGEASFSHISEHDALDDAGNKVSLTRVVIPESVTCIGDTAFLNCAALKQVNCYGPVERLGIRAFEGYGLLE